MKRVICFSIFMILFASHVQAYTFSTNVSIPLASMLKEDYYQALDECYALDRRTNRNSEKAEILHLKALCNYNLHNYADARELFKRSLKSSIGDLSTENYIGIADTYFMESNYKNAISIYKQIIDKKENKNYKANLRFKLGRAYQKQAEWTKSSIQFKALEKKYSKSLETEIAKANSTGGNFFTIQVGSFSNKDNAEKLRDDLKAKDYDSYIVTLKNNGHKLYRVRVGKFVSLVAAQYEEGQIKAKEHLPTHIFP